MLKTENKAKANQHANSKQQTANRISLIEGSAFETRPAFGGFTSRFSSGNLAMTREKPPLNHQNEAKDSTSYREWPKKEWD